MTNVMMHNIKGGLKEILEREFEVDTSCSVIIASLDSVKQIEEIISVNPNVNVILDVGFVLDDNKLDIYARKYKLKIIPKVNALFGFWQAFLGHFNPNEMVFYAGRIPRHASYPFGIVPIRPINKFIHLFEGLAYSIYNGKIEGVNPTSIVGTIPLKIDDFYYLDYLSFGFMDRYFLYTKGRRLKKLQAYILGRLGFRDEISVLSKLDLLKEQGILYLEKVFERLEEEDIFIFMAMINNKHANTVWKIEQRYKYNSRESAYDLITYSLIKVILANIDLILSKRFYLIWLSDIFAEKGLFEFLMKEIKSNGASIIYEEYNSAVL